MQQHAPLEQSKEFSETLRFSYYSSTDPLLLFLFHAKSVKESESLRISLLLGAMNGQAWTAMELLELCCGSLSSELPTPDEKTIRSDLKYLEEVGVIRKEPGPRPYKYRIQDDLIRCSRYIQILEAFLFMLLIGIILIVCIFKINIIRLLIGVPSVRHAPADGAKHHAGARIFLIKNEN